MGRLDHFGLWKHALLHPEKPAVAGADGAALTFGELAKLVARYRYGFRRSGLRGGDTIAVLLPNGADYLAAYFAAVEEGLYFTPINYHLLPDEVAFILADSGAGVFISCERLATVATEAADRAGLPPQARLAPDALAGFRMLAGAPEPGELTDAPPDAPIGTLLIYTSGTTGRPRGVRRPLPAVSDVAPARDMDQIILGSPPATGVHLVCGPFYHLGPFTPAVTALNHGCTVLLCDPWTPESFLRMVETHRVESTFMVPTHFHRLLSLPGDARDRRDVSSLRHVLHSAAPCPVALKQRMMDWLGPVIHESYAATEAGGTYVSPGEWLARPGTVGRVWGGSRLRIVDDDGNPCLPRTPGNIVFRPATPAFEYLNDPDLTARTRDGGWVKVGDIGYVDEDGYLFLAGRRSDMIISGGTNVYPAEVEARLLQHPAVQDVAVVGVPDDEWGELVHAVIQPFEHVDPTTRLAEEIIRYCRANLAHYKCPRTVEFRDDLPRTEAGKLYKRLITPSPEGSPRGPSD